MRRIGGTDKAIVQVVVQKFLEICHLCLGKGIHSSDGRFSALFEVDRKIIRTMWRKCAGLGLAKNIRVVMIIFQDAGQVNLFDISRTTRHGIRIRHSDRENNISADTSYLRICGSINKRNRRWRRIPKWNRIGGAESEVDRWLAEGLFDTCNSGEPLNPV
jgi:hypothetical protein